MEHVPLETETHLPVQSTNHQFFGFQVGGCTKLFQQIPTTLSSPSKPFSATLALLILMLQRMVHLQKKIGSKTRLHHNLLHQWHHMIDCVFPKWPHPPCFSSMLYHADAIFFSQDALWLHINIQEARFQTVQALHGAQMTTINPVDLSRSFRFQSLLATASGTIINWTSPSGKIHDLYSDIFKARL